MFSIVCFAIALMILAVFFVAAYKKRNHMREAVSCMLGGVFLSTFFMILPTDWVKAGKEVYSEPMFAAVSSLIYSIKTLSGGQDVSQLENTHLTGVCKAVYITVNYICFVLSPILTSSLILSFIGDTGERIRYFFSRAPKCYIFSDLNESAVTLAQGVKATPGRETLVFCNTKAADKDLVAEAKKLGGITLYRSCTHLRLPKRSQGYEFYLISENEDNNIALAEELISKKEELQKRKIVVNAFAQNGTHIELLESMLKKKACAVFESTHELLVKKAATIASQAPKTEMVFFNVPEGDQTLKSLTAKCSVKTYAEAWENALVDESFRQYDMQLHYLSEGAKPEVKKKGIGYCQGHLVTRWQEEPLKIRFIDEIALFCNNLLFTHPLYHLPQDRKDIFVLLVGCGRLGTQMLKTVAWSGQIEGYTLKIRVLDPKAPAIEKAFYSRYPEMKQYDIQFEDIDAEGADFEEKLKAYSDATFICVATDSDERNIATAENVFCILRRNYGGYIPPIFARVRKAQKSQNFQEKSTFLKDRSIEFFGAMAGVFSKEALFNTELENLAFAVHLCYNWALKEPKDSFNYQKALSDFYTSEYARRSSMAAALHIGAKLRSCGLMAKDRSLPTEEELVKYEEFIKNEDAKQTLARNEHERWNAFMRSEGYRSVDFETVKKYAPETRSHKDEAAKLHPCILDWEELDHLQQQYDALQQELNLKPSSFKEYDIKLVEEIPQIIRKAQQLSKEGW